MITKKLAEVTIADALVFALTVFLMYQAIVWLGLWALLLYVAWILIVTAGE